MDPATESLVLVQLALFWIEAGLIQGLAAQALAASPDLAGSRPQSPGRPDAPKEERACCARFG